MHASDGPTDEPRTAAEFHAALGALIRHAYRNGVDVEGGWSFRRNEDLPDIGVEIYEVAKPLDPWVSPG